MRMDHSTCAQCRAIFASRANLVSLTLLRGHRQHHTIKTLRLSASDGCGLCETVLDNVPEERPEMDHMTLFVSLGYDPWNEIPEDSSTHPWHNRRQEFSIQFICPDWPEWLSFTVYLVADPDNPASRYIPTRRVPEAMTSEIVASQLRSWVRQKELEDESNDDTTFVPPYLPSRVLDVQNLRLHLSRPAETAEYACLSYCWGGPQAVLTTTKNIQSHTQSLAYERLPATLRDAIKVTRQLDIQYLWIDALCIIQDSSEDKAVEISKMGDIYYNSTVTIAAATASSVEEGFLQDRVTDIGFTLDFSVDEHVTGQVILLPEVSSFAPHDPIATRAWVLQESILPNKQIIYSKQDILLLTQGVKSRTVGISPRIMGQDIPGHLDIRMVSPRYKYKFESDSQLRDVFEQLWGRIVRGLAERGMTDPEDRLPAVAGIAQVLQGYRGDEDTYIVGLWRFNMIHYLAWRGLESARLRPTKYRAPSWSWAAIDGRVKFIRFDEPTAEVISYHVEPRSKLGAFGYVQSGHVVMRGRLVDGQEQYEELGITLFLDTADDAKIVDKSCHFLFLLGMEASERAVGLILTTSVDSVGYVRRGSFYATKDWKMTARKWPFWEWPNAKMTTITIH